MSNLGQSPISKALSKTFLFTLNYNRPNCSPIIETAPAPSTKKDGCEPGLHPVEGQNPNQDLSGPLELIKNLESRNGIYIPFEVRSLLCLWVPILVPCNEREARDNLGSNLLF